MRGKASPRCSVLWRRDKGPSGGISRLSRIRVVSYRWLLANADGPLAVIDHLRFLFGDDIKLHLSRFVPIIPYLIEMRMPTRRTIRSSHIPITIPPRTLATPNPFLSTSIQTLPQRTSSVSIAFCSGGHHRRRRNPNTLTILAPVHFFPFPLPIRARSTVDHRLLNFETPSIGYKTRTRFSPSFSRRTGRLAFLRRCRRAWGKRRSHASS